MMRRAPLWLTLVPLLVGVLLYYFLWAGWARGFEAAVAEWLPGKPIAVSGFPYRLEADVRDVALTGGGGIRLAFSAPRIIVNRGPWRPQLTILRADFPRFSAVVGPGLGASFSGKSAMTSINVVDGRLLRLSSVIDAANVRLGFTSARITADGLELHARERFPGADASPAEAPTPAARGQFVASGERVRFDGGDALTLRLEAIVTGAARLTSFDRWKGTGTIELKRLSIADAHGEIVGAKATIVSVGAAGLRFAGTIETICPLGVEAAWNGLPSPRELRLRAPVQLAFSGLPGAVRLTGMPDNIAFRATRGQLPPCPVLRGVRVTSRQ